MESSEVFRTLWKVVSVSSGAECAAHVEPGGRVKKTSVGIRDAAALERSGLSSEVPGSGSRVTSRLACWYWYLA